MSNRKKKEEYALWKKSLWTFGRVFLAAFLTTTALALKDVQNLDSLWMLAVYPAIIAGISALAKYVRDRVGAGDYGNAIYRLPV